MRRIDALRSLMGRGVQRVDLYVDLAGEPTSINADMAIKLYDYLDEDLCEPKAEQQKPKEKLDERKAEFCESKDKPQKPKATAPAKKVVAGSGKRKKLDDGKMLALRKAGWTYKRISEEMGCSEQTVINHIQSREGEA